MENDIAIKEVSQISQQIAFIKQKAADLVITSEEEMAKGSDLLTEIKNVENFFSEIKEAKTRPLMTTLANIRDIFRPFETSCTDAKKTIKAKVQTFFDEQEKRIEAEKVRITDRVDRGTYRLDTAIKKLEEVGEVPKAFSGSVGTTSIRKVTKWRITDLSIVPREFLVEDSAKITQAVIREKKVVPGIEVYEEKQIVNSSKY